MAFCFSWGALITATLVAIAAWSAIKVLDWAWWKPRRVERALRAQGLKGTKYRFLYGDLKENASLFRETLAKPLPLFSHDIAHHVAPLIHKFIKEYGKLSFTWFGPVPRVIVNDPDLVREVLSNKFGHFEKPKLSPLGKFLISGLIDYDGEKWAMHRKIVNPAFHIEKLKRTLPAFYACCSELVARWDKLVGPNQSCELDVFPELQNLTADAISISAFGSSYQEGQRVFQLQVEQAELFLKAAQNVYIPGYRFLPTRDNNRRKEIDREVRAVLRGIIEKREKAIKLGSANNDDLLGLLLESNQSFHEEGKKNSSMTTEEVIAECKLFYFAGQETTSTLLTWTMIVLSMYPIWQDKAREEVLDVFGSSKPDYDSLNRLRIVTMILHEVLRLYSPVIYIPRTTCKTVKLGNVAYPPGVVFHLPIIFLHNDPDYWGKDANEFKPERFAEGVSKATKNQVPFFPFGWGPRICIGQNFALLEAKMALSLILQQFSFELSSSYIHAPRSIITLQPQHGAQLKLQRI